MAETIKEGDDKLPEVELFDAYLWLCPACAKKNFEATTSVEVSEDKFRKHFNIPEWEEAPSAVMTSIPMKVKCKRCKAKYLTFREEDAFDEEDDID